MNYVKTDLYSPRRIYFNCSDKIHNRHLSFWPTLEELGKLNVAFILVVANCEVYSDLVLLFYTMLNKNGLLDKGKELSEYFYWRQTCPWYRIIGSSFCENRAISVTFRAHVSSISSKNATLPIPMPRFVVIELVF